MNLISPDRMWHQLSAPEAIRELQSDGQAGLSGQEAAQRLASFGPNQLVELARRSWWQVLVSQLTSALVILLVAASLISLALGESLDALAIAAIIVLNTLLGFWQESKAEKALAELKKLAVAKVQVRRDGVAVFVDAADLVQGDIVLLQAGSLIPADCRIIEQAELEVDESALTGESLPVPKIVESLPEKELPLGDRTNCAFNGTLVTKGRGRAAVTATGMNTELGQIADSIQAVVAEPTPLQVKLSRLSHTLAFIAVFVVGMVFVAGLIGGQDSRLMLLTAISMAVALVPEWLPAVATVALAIGARSMFRRRALIRELPAVETLGSVSVICSDKTGTLTQNKMTATIIDVSNCRIDPQQQQLAPQCADATRLLLTVCALCNDAELDGADIENQYSGEKEKRKAVGEPTEVALVEVAANFGLEQPRLQSSMPRVAEIPFDSDRKRMTTVHEVVDREAIHGQSFDEKYAAFTKGAVDRLLEVSDFVLVDRKRVPLDQAQMDEILTSHDELASQGTRVLAMAFRPLDSISEPDTFEKEMTFIGLVGLSDPPRPEVGEAVALCRQAGIRPIMITGDHPLTATNIANQIGIADDDQVITGKQMLQMDQDELRQRVKEASVFARVAPADKLHIVEALQANHEVVAMTGDGVNDAPALKQANIGVAMGVTGTDVSKQAANVVLLDDNFATIVAAVEQGRIVYDNIRKFVKYAMSGNVGEVLVMTVGVLMAMPLPLLPLQILWVNLVTDGLPGLALALEKGEKNTMQRPPLPLDEPIFNRRMIWDLIWIGSWICLLSLLAGWWFWDESKGTNHWRTLIFTVLTFSQMVNAFACRSDRPILGQREFFGNGWLSAAVASTFILQLMLIYWQPLQSVFHTTSLSFFELSGCLASSGLLLLAIELRKLVITRTTN